MNQTLSLPTYPRSGNNMSDEQLLYQDIVQGKPTPEHLIHKNWLVYFTIWCFEQKVGHQLARKLIHYLPYYGWRALNATTTRILPKKPHIHMYHGEKEEPVCMLQVAYVHQNWHMMRWIENKLVELERPLHTELEQLMGVIWKCGGADKGKLAYLLHLMVLSGYETLPNYVVKLVMYIADIGDEFEEWYDDGRLKGWAENYSLESLDLIPLIYYLFPEYQQSTNGLINDPHKYISKYVKMYNLVRQDTITHPTLMKRGKWAFDKYIRGLNKKRMFDRSDWKEAYRR